MPENAAIDGRERLQRVLASRGVASRRKAEDLIRAGRVSVDGVVVSELGTRVDPGADIRVDGRAVRAEAARYILLNKPTGLITTTSDERGRDTVMALVDVRERVYPVGRLDRDTEGLLLLTNDGDVAHRVMHPRYRLVKEYAVLTPSRPPEAVMRRVRDGIEIDRRKVVPDEFRILRETRDGVLLTISVHEGLNRVVRRLMEEVGIPIVRLRRVRIGPLSLGSIPEGGWRDLSGGELTSLLQAVRLDEADGSHGGAMSKRGAPSERRRGVAGGGPRRQGEDPNARRGPGGAAGRAPAIPRDEGGGQPGPDRFAPGQGADAGSQPGRQPPADAQDAGGDDRRDDGRARQDERGRRGPAEPRRRAEPGRGDTETTKRPSRGAGPADQRRGRAGKPVEERPSPRPLRRDDSGPRNDRRRTGRGGRDAERGDRG